jgi:hypothetical protein
MADDKKPELTTEQRLVKLERDYADALFQIRRMQNMGGFADSKTLSMRSLRIEERTEKTEFDIEMLKDVTALLTEQASQHLVERHQMAERDNTPDAISIRKIRRRLVEWAEKRGLMDKRRDIAGARQGENRLRPQAAS